MTFRGVYECSTHAVKGHGTCFKHAMRQDVLHERRTVPQDKADWIIYELTQKIEKLYEDAVIDNLLSRDAYTTQKARLVEQRDDAHRTETEIQAEVFERTRDCSIYMERYQLYADMEVLPDDAIANLLDRVTVCPDGRLEVSLKFLNKLPVSAVAKRGTKTTE